MSYMMNCMKQKCQICILHNLSGSITSIDVVDRVTNGVESMMPCLLNGQLMYMICNIEPTKTNKTALCSSMLRFSYKRTDC